MTPGMTLLEAIGSAGGITEFANAKKIYILRDEAGKHEKIPVHYKEALKGDSALRSRSETPATRLLFLKAHR